MSAVTTRAGAETGWLRGPAFDVALIGGPFLLAIGVGHLVLALPGLWMAVFLIDTWLLGFHHVIATWAKLGLAPEDPRETWRLVVLLPPLVVAALLAVVVGGGQSAVFTIFFYWQWWHYTRQAWGLSRVFARRAGRGPDPLAAVVLYGWAVAGLANRAWEEFAFFGNRMTHLPVPGELVALLVVFASGATLAWLIRETRALSRGQGAPLHTVFVLTHAVTFSWGYLLAEGMTGWLVVNIWHNAQYLLFVWHAHASRFGRAPDQHPRLSRVVTPAGTFVYVVACLLLTGATYGAIHVATADRVIAGVPAVIVLTMAINWHHYVVDARIWRLRRPRVAAALGLTA